MKRKFMAIVVAFLLIFANATTVLAVENTNDDVSYEIHEIIITVPAGEDQSIAPCMWEDGTYYPDPNRDMDTPDFTIDSDHHFFCFKATVTGNSPGICSIVLRNNSSERCTMNADVNGGERTKDWISVTSGGTYFFRVTNRTSSVVRIYIKYYSFSG